MAGMAKERAGGREKVKRGFGKEKSLTVLVY